MTLGEFKQELDSLGIKQVSKLKRPNGVLISFSNDQKIVYPFPLKNVHSISLPTDDETQTVNVEVREALKRRLLPNGSN